MREMNLLFWVMNVEYVVNSIRGYVYSDFGYFCRLLNEMFFIYLLIILVILILIVFEYDFVMNILVCFLFLLRMFIVRLGLEEICYYVII